MQAEKKRSEAEEDAEKKLAEMERRKDKVEASEADVGGSVTETKKEFDALKENLQNSSARLDSAFWWLDVAGWAAPVGSLVIYFGVFFYYSLPLDPFGYAGLAIIIPMALFLRLLIWYVRLQVSGQDISFIQSIKESFRSLPGNRFRLGFRPTKLDSKVSTLWDRASTLTKAVQNYVPGVREYYEGQDRVRNEKDFTVTLRNALGEYGLKRSDRVESYLSQFGPSTGTEAEWIGKAASDLAMIYSIPAPIIRFAYADYVGDDPARKDSWSTIVVTPKTFQALVDVLVNSGKLPGQYHEKGKGAYGGIEELILKTNPFSLSSFLENYNIQYYQYAAEKDSLFDAAKTYHIKTTAAIESEIKRLVPPTFEKERRLDTLLEKASSLMGVEESILTLIFYEREAVSDKREKAWAAVKKSVDEPKLSDEPQDPPDEADKNAKSALEHFSRILVDGGLVDVPEDYHEKAIGYILGVLRAQPDFTLPTGKSEVRQAFGSLKAEKDSLLRTLAANNIQLAEGDRAEFAKLLPVGDTLSTLITSLVSATKVSDYILLLLYYDFTAQRRKRDDYFGDLKKDEVKLSALAQELLNRKLVSTVERNEKEKTENVSNLAAYLFTQKEFTKPLIDSVFSDYSRLFEYSRAVLEFQKAQKICRESSDARFSEVLEHVPRPEADFFANFVHVIELQLRQFSGMKLEAQGWLEPTALAVATAFLVTREDVFLADVACRRTAANLRSVKVLYEYSWINDDEQHMPPTDRTPFSVAVQRAIDGSNPRIEYESDFQRGLASGFLFRKISEIPITRLHRIEDKVSKVLKEVDFEKRLTTHLQALKTFLHSELRSGIIMESLRMQLVTAYAITVPTTADVISGVIEPLLPKVCEELAKNDASYRNLFIDDEATQPKIGKYTRLGVVPYGMSFSTFSQKMKRAYQIATDRFSESGGMIKHQKQDYVANIIRIFPTEAYFKQLEPSLEGKTKSAEEFLSELIEPILLEKFGEVRTAEILASLKTKEEDQVAMRGVLTKLYDTSGALYLLSKDEFDGAVSSPLLGEYIRAGKFDIDLANSFNKTKLSDLATTIFRSARKSQTEEENVRDRLTRSVEQISAAIRARQSPKEVESTSKVAFQVLFDIGMILDGL